MKPPLLSVLLTTYNRAELIGYAIRSVLNQTCTDFELIILDDCSPDHTSTVVSAFQDQRIRYIRNSTNLGFSENFKNGIAMARGTYVFLLSDDDIIMRRDTFMAVADGMDRYQAGVGSMSLLFYESDMFHPAYYVPVSRTLRYLPPSPANILTTKTWHFGFMSGNVYRRARIRLDDIGDDLWIAHLKPLWRLLVSDGCVYFGEHFIVAKISTSGNIGNLDVQINNGYHLPKQLALYQEFDDSTVRYNEFRKFHVEGVCSSFFGVKYFSSSRNLVKIAQELIRLDPSKRLNPLFIAKIIIAMITPRWALRTMRFIKLQLNIQKTKSLCKAIHLKSHLTQVLQETHEH